MSDSQGHSSYLVWLVYEFRAIARILPNLKTKPKHGWVAPFFLCLLVLGALVGMGIYVDGYGIHPPANYTGVCPRPAQIKSGGCYLIIVSQVTVSGTVSYSTISQSAGHIILPNATGGK